MNKSNPHEIMQNHRVQYKYIIEKKIESGVVLLGWEVKAVRSKMITIDNSYISFRGKEAYIYNSIFQIPTQQHHSIYNPTRIRKLLLKKQELLFLKNKIDNYKYTAVILSIFWKNSWIKVNIGIAKGIKKYDKRYLINKNKWKQEKIYITKKYK